MGFEIRCGKMLWRSSALKQRNRPWRDQQDERDNRKREEKDWVRAGLECGPAAPIAALSADELCSKVSTASTRESRQEEGA